MSNHPESAEGDPSASSTTAQDPGGSSRVQNGDAPKGTKWELSRLLTAAAFLAVAIVILLWRMPMIIEGVAQLDSPVQLFFWMIGGVGALLAAVLLLSVASEQHDPEGNDRGALGLPHGSISAILALIILAVFAITSVFLFNELRAAEGEGYTSTGVPSEVLAQLPTDRVLSISEQTPAAGDQPATYQVLMSAEHPTSTDFAQSLLTIFSTLLAAIVGFYFGQGAATKGTREALKHPGTSPGTTPPGHASQ